MTSVIPLNTDRRGGERKQEELRPARLWRRSEAGQRERRARKEGTFWMRLKKKTKKRKNDEDTDDKTQKDSPTFR